MTKESKSSHESSLRERRGRCYLVSGPGLSEKDLRPGTKATLLPVEYADVVTDPDLPTFG